MLAKELLDQGVRVPWFHVRAGGRTSAKRATDVCTDARPGRVGDSTQEIVRGSLEKWFGPKLHRLGQMLGGVWCKKAAEARLSPQDGQTWTALDRPWSSGGDSNAWRPHPQHAWLEETPLRRRWIGRDRRTRPDRRERRRRNDRAHADRGGRGQHLTRHCRWCLRHGRDLRGHGCAWCGSRSATNEDPRCVSTETLGERSRLHHSEDQASRAPPVEEGGGLPPVGPRGKRLLQVHVDHWRPALRSTSDGSRNRRSARVQHPESHDRAQSTGLVCDRAVKLSGRGGGRLSHALEFMHQRVDVQLYRRPHLAEVAQPSVAEAIGPVVKPR